MRFWKTTQRRKRFQRSGYSTESLEVRELLTTLPPGFTEVQVADLNTNPTAIASTPDGRLLIATDNNANTGTIRVIKNGTLLPTPALQFTIFSQGEQGINGMTIDPDFINNNFVYVYYTTDQGGRHNRLSRFTFSGDTVISGSEFVLMDFDLLGAGTIHNGGGMAFGSDGKLYLGIGDNVNSANARTLNNQFGKILRLNSNGTIPTDNPFFSVANGDNRAIYAIGVRSPYSVAADPVSGRIFFNDVGSSLFEEINELQAGGDYGWAINEGSTNDPAYVSPIYAYPHGMAIYQGCAVTGGTFYQPTISQFPAAYANKYFFIDFCSGWIDTYDLTTGAVAQFASGLETESIALHVDALGAMYYLSQDTGRVMKIEYPVNAPPAIAYEPHNSSVAAGEATSFEVSVGGTAPFTYQWQKNGINIPGAVSKSLSIGSASLADNGAVYRVAVSNAFGSILSAGATLSVIAGHRPLPVITLPLEGGTYIAGNQIQFSGSATDAEDGVLPIGSLTWKVLFHHDAHAHPVLGPFSGAAGGTFTVPTVGETSPDTWFRIHLTAIDSTGLTTEITRDIFPETSSFTLTSNVPGIVLSLDGSPVSNPSATTGVVGMARSISTAATQVVNGREFQFVRWSDGGAIAHTIATPASNTLFRAVFGAIDQLTPPVLTGPSGTTVSLKPTFTWTSVLGAANYEVWIRNSTTQQNPYRQAITSGASYTSPSDMEIGRFTIWIRSLGANGHMSAWSTPVDININTPVTLNPMSITQTTSRPTVSWAALPGAVKYDLWLNNTATGQAQYVRNTNITTTSWTSSFDLPMAGYRVWVRGIDAGGVARYWSAPMDFNVVPIPVLTTPSNLTLSLRPAFTWNPIAGAVSYDIWIRNATTQVNPYHQGSSTTAGYTPPADFQIGRFNVWLRSRSAFGHVSAWSPAVDINISTPVTLNPITFQQPTARPTVSWQPLPGAVKYDLWLDNRSTGPSQVVRNTALTTTSWTSAADLPMGRYRVWVRGIDAGNEPRSWSALQDFLVAPSPVLVSPIDATFNRTPVFQWTSVLGATQYQIVVRQGSQTVFQSTVSTNSFTSPSALSDGVYFWRVQAIRPTEPNGIAGVSSLFTDESQVRIGGQPTLTGPSGSTSATPLFTWSNVQGAASYELRVGTFPDVSLANIINVTGLTSNTYTHSSPLTAGTYRVWVRAVSTSNENSVWSAMGTFSVVHETPAIDRLMHELATGTNVNILWVELC